MAHQSSSPRIIKFAPLFLLTLITSWFLMQVSTLSLSVFLNSLAVVSSMVASLEVFLNVTVLLSGTVVNDEDWWTILKIGGLTLYLKKIRNNSAKHENVGKK